mmetsp:Transcript_15528/g.29646  ORF Transcript_15528/g.29646 Transcript_15528/m.29646 type:complete len:92 (-) Transcript_15528:545-820(-)
MDLLRIGFMYMIPVPFIKAALRYSNTTTKNRANYVSGSPIDREYGTSLGLCTTRIESLQDCFKFQMFHEGSFANLSFHGDDGIVGYLCTDL